MNWRSTCDAGPPYAYIDADDAHHASCLELLEVHPGPLVLPTMDSVEEGNPGGVIGL